MSDTKDQDDETTIKRFNPTAMLAELRQVVAETKHGAPGYLTLRGALDLYEHLIAKNDNLTLLVDGLSETNATLERVLRHRIAEAARNTATVVAGVDAGESASMAAAALQGFAKAVEEMVPEAEPQTHAELREYLGREGEARADRQAIEREIERLRPVMLALMKWCRAPIGIETWNASNALREAFESFASNGMLARFLEEPAKVDPPNPDRTLNREEAREELRKLGMPDVGIDFYLSDPRTYAGAFREPYDSIIAAHARWLDAQAKKSWFDSHTNKAAEGSFCGEGGSVSPAKGES